MYIFLIKLAEQPQKQSLDKNKPLKAKLPSKAALQSLSDLSSSIQSNRKNYDKKVIGMNILLKGIEDGKSLQAAAKQAEKIMTGPDGTKIISYKTLIRAYQEIINSDADMKSVFELPTSVGRPQKVPDGNPS